MQIKNYAHAKEFWKLERGQVFAEPGDASWEAFDSGDWEKSMRLVEERREDLTQRYQENAAAGRTSCRIRIVSLPPTAYLQWELHLLRLRDEGGGPIRILLDSEVALGLTEASREHVALARTLIQRFPDDRAVQLRTDLQARAYHDPPSADGRRSA